MSTTGKVIIVFLVLAFLATAGIIYFKDSLGFALKDKELDRPAVIATPGAAPLPSLQAQAGQDLLADAQQLAAGGIDKLLGNVSSNVSQIPGSIT